MGLFSGSKKVYSGGVILSPLYEEKPNVIKEVILRSIKDGTSITENINAAHLNGFNSMAARFLSYGRKYYTFGLPEGDKSYGIVSTSKIKEVLDDVVGSSVTIRYAQVDDPNYFRYAAEYCQKHYGWDYTTGELSSPPTGVNPVLLSSATNDGTTLSMTFSHNPKQTRVRTSTGQNNSMSTSAFIWSEITTYSYFTLTVPMDISGLSYHVEYTIDSDLDDPQKVYLWNYSAHTNQYEQLIIADSVKYESQFYPVVPFRRNRRNVSQDPSSQLYITGNKLLDKVGLSIDTLVDGISEGNNISDIDEAFYMFALDINTELPEGKEYLFKYWQKEADENSRLPSEVEEIVNTPLLPLNTSFLYRLANTAPPTSTETDVPTKTITVTDGEFNTEIKYSGITNFTTKNRVIGTLNTVTLVKTVLPQGYIAYPSTGVGMASFGYSRSSYERSYITIEKQISATETETIKVYGLEHKTVIAGVRGILWKVNTTLASGSFYFPVDYSVVKTFSGIDESKILMESASVLIYWTNVTKVKTGGVFGGIISKIFSNKFLMIALIIVSFIVSAGSVAAAWSKIASLTASQVLQSVAISILTSYGLKKLGEIGGIFAVVAAVYGMYHYKVGPFAPDAKTLADPSWADSLLNAVTMISDQFNNLIAIDMQELMEDTEDFFKYKEEKTEELEAAQDLLDNGNEYAFDPLFIVRQVNYFNPDESPTAYYNRALETNPGVASLEYTSLFTEMSLQLPTFNGLNDVTSHNEYAYNG